MDTQMQPVVLAGPKFKHTSVFLLFRKWNKIEEVCFFFTLPFHFTHEFVTKREQALRKNLPLGKKKLLVGII